MFRILQLLNKRKLEKLKETWWTNNPKKAVCDKQNEETDGISIQNIGKFYSLPRKKSVDFFEMGFISTKAKDNQTLRVHLL